MNREIKFRAWSQLGDEMLYQADLRHLALAEFELESNLVWLQYTGLKDKNGVEIYEGDVIRCKMTFEGGFLPHIGQIVYDTEHGAFATLNLGGVTLLHNHLLSSAEIIGNIYENPELMQTEQ